MGTPDQTQPATVPVETAPAETAGFAPAPALTPGLMGTPDSDQPLTTPTIAQPLTIPVIMPAEQAGLAETQPETVNLAGPATAPIPAPVEVKPVAGPASTLDPGQDIAVCPVCQYRFNIGDAIL